MSIYMDEMVEKRASAKSHAIISPNDRSLGDLLHKLMKQACVFIGVDLAEAGLSG
jgi:hypothetical protein